MVIRHDKPLPPLHTACEVEIRHQRITDLLQLFGVQPCPSTIQPWDLDHIGVHRSANGGMSLCAAQVHELLWITRVSPIVPLVHNPWQYHAGPRL